MKKSFLLTLASAAMAVGLTSCSPYSSHYSAILMVENHTPKNSSISFQSLKGTFVFNMSFGSDNSKLTYSGKIDSGAANIYYDNSGTKEQLFALEAGEDVQDTFTELHEGKLYIIIETVDACKAGEFHFVIS